MNYIKPCSMCGVVKTLNNTYWYKKKNLFYSRCKKCLSKAFKTDRITKIGKLCNRTSLIVCRSCDKYKTSDNTMLREVDGVTRLVSRCNECLNAEAKAKYKRVGRVKTDHKFTPKNKPTHKEDRANFVAWFNSHKEEIFNENN